MKRLRFDSGQGNGSAIIPNGQILTISMVPGEAGSWVQINVSKPIWVPPGTTLALNADDLGLCCGEPNCDKFPGEVQIEIIFGQDVDGVPVDATGDPPLAWLVIHNGC